MSPTRGKNKNKATEIVIDSYKIHEKDTGSSAVQIALLTERINSLAGHFKLYKKDHHSRQGLIKLVNKRRSLLDYLKRVDVKQYQEIIIYVNPYT